MQYTIYPRYYKNKSEEIPYSKLKNAPYVLGKINARGYEFIPLKNIKEVSAFVKGHDPPDRIFTELIRKGDRSKVYLDFDLPVSPEMVDTEKIEQELIDSTVTMMSICFQVNVGTEDVYLYTSNRPSKVSYHVIVDGYYVEDVSQIKESGFCEYLCEDISLKFPEWEEEEWFPRGGWSTIIDGSVYGKMSHLRMNYCRKPGHTRGKKYVRRDNRENGNLFRISLRGYVGKCQPLNLTSLEDTDDTSESVFDDLNGESEEDVDLIKMLVGCLSDERACAYGEWLRVGAAIYNTLPTSDGYEIWDDFSQRGTYDPTGVKRYWRVFSQHTSPRKITVRSLMKWAKEDDPKTFAKCVTPRVDIKKLERFCNPESVLKEAPLGTTYENSRYLTPLPIDESVCVKSYLGTGKTYQIAQSPEIKDVSKSVLITTNRRLLAHDLERSLECLGFVNYLQCPRGVIKHRRIVVQMESMWRIEPPKGGFDLLIIEESESCLSQFTSSTMERRYHENITVFETIVKNARRFIAVDAFLSNRTLNFLELIGAGDYSLRVNTYNPQRRSATEIEMAPIKDSRQYSLSPLNEKAYKKLGKGKRVFYVFASKAKLEEFVSGIPEGVSYRKYAGGHTRKYFDVTKEWSSVQCVCITSTITTGVNYDPEEVEKRFDYLFVYFSNGPLVRDLFQSTMRAREINSNKCYYSIQPYCIPRGDTSRRDIVERLKTSGQWYSFFTGDSVKERGWLLECVLFSSLEAGLQSRHYRKIVKSYLRYCGYTSEKKVDAFEVDADNILEGTCALAFSEIDIEGLDESYIRHLKTKPNPSEMEMAQIRKFEFIHLFQKYSMIERELGVVFDRLQCDTEYKKVFLNVRRWKRFSPKTTLEIDITNPEVSSTAKLVVMNELQRLLDFDPFKGHVFHADTLNELGSNQIINDAVQIFKLKFRGDKVKPITKVKRLFLVTFLGTLKVKVKQVRIDGKQVYRNEYVYTPDDSLSKVVSHIIL